MGKPKPKNWPAGRWLIESMTNGTGTSLTRWFVATSSSTRRTPAHFQFGYVEGQIDYRLGERDGKSAIEFTWDGNDEMDPAQGRGWLVLEGDELKGRFYIHHGDESGSCSSGSQKRSE